MNTSLLPCGHSQHTNEALQGNLFHMECCVAVTSTNFMLPVSKPVASQMPPSLRIRHFRPMLLATTALWETHCDSSFVIEYKSMQRSRVTASSICIALSLQSTFQFSLPDFCWSVKNSPLSSHFNHTSQFIIVIITIDHSFAVSLSC